MPKSFLSRLVLTLIFLLVALQLPFPICDSYSCSLTVIELLAVRRSHRATTAFSFSLTALLTLVLIIGHESLVFYKWLFLCLVLMMMVSEKLGVVPSINVYFLLCMTPTNINVEMAELV